MLIIAGYMNVEPSQLAEFLDDLKMLAAAARSRPENVSYDAAIDDAATGRLLILERWRDQAGLVAHLAAADTQGFVGRWRGRMQAELRKFDATNERGLMDD